jgi:hypothetical protein
MKADLTGFKEVQLRQVLEDYGRCHPADPRCAERQQLKHEACLELDRERLEREEEACYRAPGCDWGEFCMELARSASEERVAACTTEKA